MSAATCPLDGILATADSQAAVSSRPADNWVTEASRSCSSAISAAMGSNGVGQSCHLCSYEVRQSCHLCSYGSSNHAISAATKSDSRAISAATYTAGQQRNSQASNRSQCSTRNDLIDASSFDYPTSRWYIDEIGVVLDAATDDAPHVVTAACNNTTLAVYDPVQHEPMEVPQQEQIELLKAQLYGSVEALRELRETNQELEKENVALTKDMVWIPTGVQGSGLDATVETTELSVLLKSRFTK